MNSARIGCCTLADHLMPNKRNTLRRVQVAAEPLPLCDCVLWQEFKPSSIIRAVCSQTEAICQVSCDTPRTD